MRKPAIKRETKETRISVELDLDGGEVNISTGIGFFDHMLTAFAVHGGFGLCVETKGDLEVDCHHTVEDTGIVIGKAFSEALGDKSGIARFGSFYVPMDEALGFCSLDISGRPFLVFDAEFPQEQIGSYDSCMTEEFNQIIQGIIDKVHKRIIIVYRQRHQPWVKIMHQFFEQSNISVLIKKVQCRHIQ